MKLSILANGSWVDKKANLLAVSEDVKDETLDTAQVQIMFDEREEEYPPRTLVCLTEGGVDTYYCLALDNVGIQTLEPRTYRHRLNLVQTTRALSHHVLPNMVITKPREGAARTYFRNENAINVKYYQNSAAPAQAPETWDGFTTRYATSLPTFYRKTQPSPYWGECLALTTHTEAIRARIKVHWEAIVCSYNSTAGTATATPTRLSRSLETPYWLTTYLRVYHTSKNVNTQEDDRNITDLVEIAKIPLSDVTWDADCGYVDLSASQLSALNSYTSGYVMCDLISEATGDVPTTLLDPEDQTPLTALYDRLFVDKTEFTGNGIQTIWSDVSLELSYKKASLYDTLSKILNRQRLCYENHEPEPLFVLPEEGDDYETLVNTESPEFTFSNLTVFEAVSQVLEAIDALPRFETGHDGRHYLKLDYFSSRGEEIPSNTKFASYVKDASEQKKDNGVVTHFQNAEILSTFPAKPYKGTPVYARCRVKSYGTPEYTDFALALDKPIKYVNHLWLKTPVDYYVAYPTGETWATGIPVYAYKTATLSLPVDVASYVFDEGTYSSALDQGADYPQRYNHNVRMQMNCLRFKSGSKEITVGNRATDQWNHVYNTLWNCWNVAKDRAVGRYAQNHGVNVNPVVPTSMLYSAVIPEESSFREVYFSCEYGTDADGRLEIQSPYPKEEGQFIVSAGGSSPDIGKLGLNMIGISLKSGEPTMTCGQLISTFDNRIKIGQTFSKDGATWVATKASYVTLGEDAIKGTIEFTKNFNGLSKRIAIDQRKRLYAIDRSITQLCEGNVTNYVYCVPVKPYGTGTDAKGSGCPFSDANVAKMALKPFSDDDGAYSIVSYALVSCPNAGVSCVYMPITVYGAGNCLCFEGKFDDPISAGIAMKATQDGSTGWWASDAWNAIVQSYYYYGYDVKYADAEGYGDKYAVTYYANDGETAFDDTFPYCPSIQGTELGEIDNLAYDKQPNEVFGLNFELAFLSKVHGGDGEVFFGKRFFDAWDEKKGLKAKELYFYYSTDEEYAPMDGKAKGNGLALRYAVASTGSTDGRCYLDFYTSYLSTQSRTVAVKSWAIADAEGNLMIACNHAFALAFTRFAAPTLPRLHLFTRAKRIS